MYKVATCLKCRLSFEKRQNSRAKYCGECSPVKQKIRLFVGKNLINHTPKEN